MRAATRRRRSLPIASILLVAVLAACSSTSPDSSPPSTSSPSDIAADRDVDESPASVPSESSDTNASIDLGSSGDEESPIEDGARFLDGDPEYLFDQERLHTFRISLSDDALTELDADPVAEEYVEGTFDFDGETVERVGVRYKGSIGAFFGCTAGSDPFNPSGPKTCTKLSFKLRVDWDDVDDGREFYGQRRIQLHALNLDPTLMRDRLGYHLFREMGVAAPRSTHARVEVNGEFVGVFALVEQIDGRFVRDRFDDGSGNLYKELWPFDSNGEIHSEEQFIDSLRTNRNDDPDADLVRSFAEAVASVDRSDPDAVAAMFAEWTDIDAFVAHAVVDRAIRHDDGPFHWYCYAGFGCEPHNFYVYEEPESGRIHMIPWDLDNAFAPDNPVTAIADEWGQITDDCEEFRFGPFDLPQKSAACDPLVDAWASLSDDFDRIDSELRSGPFSEAAVGELLDRWTAQIEPLVAEAAALHDDAPSVDAWRAAVDVLRSFPIDA